MTRKHATDGHVREATAEDIKIGTVLRQVHTDGGVSPFADTVVIGISSSDDGYDRKWYKCAADASELSVSVSLARPYLYADNIGGGMPNCLQGVERFTAGLKSVLTLYYVVEMSTGELANFNNRRYMPIVAGG